MKIKLKEKILPLSLRLLGAIITFISGVYISRLLGAEQSGYYYVSLNIISILAVAVNFGYGTKVLKICSNKKTAKEEKETLVYSSIVSIFIFSLVSILFIFVDVVFLNSGIIYKELIVPIVIMSVAIFFVATTNVLVSYLQANEHLNKMIVYQSILMPLLTIIFLIITKCVISENINKDTASIIYLISVLITFGFSLKSALGELNYSKFRYIKPKSDNLSYLLINVITILFSQGVILIVSQNVNIDEVSKILAAQRISNVVNFIYTSILMVYLSSIINLYNNDIEKFPVLVKKSSKLIQITTIPIIIFLLITSDVITSIYGSGFIGASDYLKVLLISQVINTICFTSTNVLLVTNNEILLRRIYIVTLIMSCILSCVLPLLYGTKGAIWAVSISSCITNFVSLFAFRFKFKFFAI